MTEDKTVSTSSKEEVIVSCQYSSSDGACLSAMVLHRHSPVPVEVHDEFHITIVVTNGEHRTIVCTVVDAHVCDFDVLLNRDSFQWSHGVD